MKEATSSNVVADLLLMPLSRGMLLRQTAARFSDPTAEPPVPDEQSLL